MTTKKEQIYMNPLTGSLGTYDEWWFQDESGEWINAVELGEVEEVESI
jgi:hypothetical protein